MAKNKKKSETAAEKSETSEEQKYSGDIHSTDLISLLRDQDEQTLNDLVELRDRLAGKT